MRLIKIVQNKIKKLGVAPEFVSPGLCAEIARNLNIKLTSEQIIFCSDTYK